LKAQSHGGKRHQLCWNSLKKKERLGEGEGRQGKRSNERGGGGDHIGGGGTITAGKIKRKRTGEGKLKRFEVWSGRRRGGDGWLNLSVNEGGEKKTKVKEKIGLCVEGVKRSTRFEKTSEVENGEVGIIHIAGLKGGERKKKDCSHTRKEGGGYNTRSAGAVGGFATSG